MVKQEYLYAAGVLGLGLAMSGRAEGDEPDTPPTEPSPSEIVVVADAAGGVTYEITIEGSNVERAGEGDLAAESNDTVMSNGDGTWTVSGFTGNAGYGDTYRYTGEVTEFLELESQTEYRVLIDGSDVTESIVTVPDFGSGPSLGAIGGGNGYSDTVTRSMAHYVANTRSELDDALASAGRGEIVFVAADISNGNGINVPSGVTLASGRGTSDPTATIHSDVDETAIYADDGARITGLVQSGGETGYRRHESFEGGLYIGGEGIDAGANVRIDNCEVFGHERCISLNGQNSTVEYSHVHHALQGGTGYGVRVNADGGEVAYSMLDYNRHSIAAAGNDGYHVHDNWFGPNHAGHVVDHHGNESGSLTASIEIDHNRVEQYLRPQTLPGYNGEPIEVRNAGGPAATVLIRDAPSGQCDIHHNWTNHPDGPFPGGTDECIGQGSWHRPAITQMENVAPSCSAYQGTLEAYDNHYGSSTPSDSSIGPRA